MELKLKIIFVGMKTIKIKIVLDLCENNKINLRFYPI